MKKWIVRVHDNKTGDIKSVDFVNTREHSRRVKYQYKSTFRLNKVTIGKAIVNSEGALLPTVRFIINETDHYETILVSKD